MAELSRPLDDGSRAWAYFTAALCLAPLLRQLPPMLAFGIGAIALVVGGVSWRRKLPGFARGLLALAIAGAVLAQYQFHFGRDTGCALLAAMIALKPAETSTLRDARSLLGFALFAPFSAFLLDQGPATLVLGLASTLFALAALQRFSALEASVGTVAPVAALARAARLAVLGLPMAMAVFWLFPRIASPMWGLPDRAQARPGLSDRMSPGDWVDLLGDDSVAMRVRFSGVTPPRQSMYWRGPVLWDFDGRAWTRKQLPAAARARVATGDERWAYELEVEPTDRDGLVSLDLPLAAPDGAQLDNDSSLHTPRPLDTLTRWRMTSSPPRSFQAELPAYLRQRALALPAGFNPRTVELGRDLRARLRDDGAIINYALGWIRRDFAYSIAAPPLGHDTADEFLFRTRLGYCEYFSGSFAILMRSAGIPTRVVTGYVGGIRNGLGDYWMVRRMDAHAWDEVWLPQRGWVRIDPTAAVAPENIYDTLEDRVGNGGLLDALQGAGGVNPFGDWMRRGWNDMVLGFDARRQERMFRPLGLDRISPSQLAALFGVAALAGLGVMLAFSLRVPRENDPVLRAWHALGRRYSRNGLTRDPAEPPTTWAERISKARLRERPELLDLVARFTRWRYAGDIADSQSARRLARDLRRHRPS